MSASVKRPDAYPAYHPVGQDVEQGGSVDYKGASQAHEFMRKGFVNKVFGESPAVDLGSTAQRSPRPTARWRRTPR
jgi:hypothetical protein